MPPDSPAHPLTVRELRGLAQTLELPAFLDRFGPIVLVQAPTPEKLQKLAGMLGRRGGTMMEDGTRPDGFQQTAELDELLVRALPKLKAKDALRVGRDPDCHLMIEDPTVSKHHATVHWDEEHARFTVVDQNSRNGTFLNAAKVKLTRLGLDNGDLLSFGSAHFLYFQTEALRARLRGENDGSFIIERG